MTTRIFDLKVNDVILYENEKVTITERGNQCPASMYIRGVSDKGNHLWCEVPYTSDKTFEKI